jgi:autoinducer 2-degrading protein
MLVVHIQIRVKPQQIEAFKAATLLNARASLLEPGIARFDVIQSQDDPAHFVFVEVYQTPEAPAAHKQTAHYAAWRDAVAEMMAEPRASRKFESLFPSPVRWQTPEA